VLGGVMAGYSQTSYFTGSKSSRLTASWNKQIKRASLSVNLEQDIGGSSVAGKDTRVYAMVSFPLGKASARTYVNNSRRNTQVGAQISQTVNEYFNYNVSADTTTTGQPNVSGNIGLLPRYTQAGLGYARNGASSMYSTQLQGGVIATRAGVTPSPLAIGDTFGMVSADGESGVRISTPQGNVWTDPWGHAAIPSLPAYRQSSVGVVTKSLARNVDVKNGVNVLNAGRGSVSVIKFGMVRVRRLLLTTTLADGTLLPSRTTIVDSDGNYVTTSVDGGALFLDDEPASALRAMLPNGKSCRLDFALPKESDAVVLYETAASTCVD
jgi:outer membrane usher protein FimD/PapC